MRRILSGDSNNTFGRYLQTCHDVASHLGMPPAVWIGICGCRKQKGQFASD